MSTIKSSIALLAWSSLAISCVPADRSQLKHNFGEITRDEKVLPADYRRQSCEFDNYTAMEGDPGLQAMRKRAQSYLTNLGTRIMARVNRSLESEGKPPAFSAALAPEKFCFAIHDSIDMPMNASMQTKSLTLTMMPAIFEKLSNEAAIAGVVCHELAHATMRHFGQAIRPDLETKFLPTQAEKEKFELSVNGMLPFASLSLRPSILHKIFGEKSSHARRLAKLHNEMNDVMTTRVTARLLGGLSRSDLVMQALYFGYRNQQVYQLFSNINRADEGYNPNHEFELTESEAEEVRYFKEKAATLDTNIIGTDPITGTDMTLRDGMNFLHDLAVKLIDAYDMQELALLNWKESEADQVGLEICARAGIDISQYDEFYRLSDNFRDQNLENMSGSLEQCIEILEDEKMPNRFGDTHPDPCWRIFDVTYREPSIHRKELEQINKDLANDRNKDFGPITDPQDLSLIKEMIRQLRIK